MNTQPQLSRVLIGAAVGAGFSFLFLTRSGQRILDSAEPWLNDLIRDLRRVRAAAAKAQEAIEEGRHSFSALADFSRFKAQTSDPLTAEDTRH